MNVVIGSARHDENGKYSGGRKGDQTGHEVETQNFYVHKKGWVILRPTSERLASAIAEKMKTACKNSNIGYSQSDRYSLLKYGVNTKTKCNCDCSSLVRECVKEASGKDPGDFTTANEATKLKALGLFQPVFNYTSKTLLYTGDILVTKTKGHTVIVTSGYTRSKSNITQVAKEVIAGKWGNGEERKNRLTKAGYNYWSVQNEVNKLLK